MSMRSAIEFSIECSPDWTKEQALELIDHTSYADHAVLADEGPEDDQNGLWLDGKGVLHGLYYEVHPEEFFSAFLEHSKQHPDHLMTASVCVHESTEMVEAGRVRLAFFKGKQWDLTMDMTLASRVAVSLALDYVLKRYDDFASSFKLKNQETTRATLEKLAELLRVDP